MFTNLKVLFSVVAAIIFTSSCSLLESPQEIAEHFSISPSEYHGHNLTGMVRFVDEVTNLVWSSASGVAVFDGKNYADSVWGDTVSIYYNSIPMVKNPLFYEISDTDTNIVEEFIPRETDTIYIRFIYGGRFHTKSTLIHLKNYRPVVDSFTVTNGNLVRHEGVWRASFLIGSGTGRINCFVTDLAGDSLNVYWSSRTGLIAERELNSFIPFEFVIPDSVTTETVFVRINNTFGASRTDSVIVTMYKERGSVWIADDTDRLYKFSAQGQLINIIDSVFPEQIEFLERENTLFVLSNNSISKYHTSDGSLIGNLPLPSTAGVINLYRAEDEIFITSQQANTTNIHRYTQNSRLEEVMVVDALVKNLTRITDRYVTVESRNDSDFVVIYASRQPVSTGNGFLRVIQIVPDRERGNIIVLDDIVNSVFVINVETDSVIASFTGFTKPIHAAIDSYNATLYVLDGSNALVSLDISNPSGSNSIESIASRRTLGLDKPWFISVNPYNDGDGFGNIWICDTHSNRVAKIDRAGNILVSISGFFRFPKRLAISRGI